ncbi:Fe(3+) ABC transporter substrate-binding protein [Fervidobacterium gondwanense]|uniref:Fe(3+) ABC transporter substrate-binding protein n=1 Tax=Fervidobacterium gondwanense TaxID=44754 RepID=UPI003C76E6D2
MKFRSLFLVLSFLLLAGTVLLANGVVNVYTDRHYETDDAIFKLFEQSTNIKVNVLKIGSDELVQRLKLEGKNMQADLIIVADVGRLYSAKEEGLLQPVKSEFLNRVIPEKFRDVDNYWFALTKRARVIVYSKERVNPSEIKTYQDLANPKWKGKILVRTSAHVYNRSLLASLIALHGEDYARDWASKIVSNLAREPKGNDRDQIKAIAAGVGDIAIVNSYYVGLMINSSDPEERSAVSKIGVIFPNPTHVNISGMGLVRYAKNHHNAIKLMEFLLSPKVQKMYADANYEFPINPEVEPGELLKSWGTFTEQNIRLSRIGELGSKAAMIFNIVGWK